MSNLHKFIDPWGSVSLLPFDASNACALCDGECVRDERAKTLSCRDKRCGAVALISYRLHEGKRVTFLEWARSA